MKKSVKTAIAMGLTAMSLSLPGWAAAADYRMVENGNDPVLGLAKDSGVELLTQDGHRFKDLNRNGKLDKYEDWRLSAQKRAEDLSQKLSIDQIAGLMLYSMHQKDLKAEITAAQKKMLKEDNVRTVLNADTAASPTLTVEWNNAMQAYAESLPFGIPCNTSSDPRNDARPNGVYLQNLTGKVSRWPSNLGVAATFSPAIAKEFGRVSAEESRAMGIGTALAPQIDLATDPRWNRIYGTFGEDPALSRDLAQAMMDGMQSTYDVNGNDQGWGAESINAMMKHWPGDGAGESGRESHAPSGKYAVYPGNNFNTLLTPFVDGGLKLKGKTKMPSAVMTSYSIAWDENGKYGEPVGTGFSNFKIGLLRNKYHYDGVICTDWAVTHPRPNVSAIGMPWGMEAASYTEADRHYKALMAGVDQFGGNSDKKPVLEAYQMGVKAHGEAYMDKRFRQSATRLLRNIFQLGLFENPYLDPAASEKIVSNPANHKAGYEAQLKSIVLLKNKGHVIQQAKVRTEKPTVYIPMVFRPSQSKPVPTGHVNTDAVWRLPVNREQVEKYVNIVTDSVPKQTARNDKGEPMAAINDIVRLSPKKIAECDYVWNFIDGPTPMGNQREGYGYFEGEYVPISLQYKPYKADGPHVRRHSIAHDEGEDRSYFGKMSHMFNGTDYDGVAYSRESVRQTGKNIPVVTIVSEEKPAVFSEIEPLSDALLVGFGVSDSAYCDILLGNAEPQGLLPIQQPRDMDAVETQLEDMPRDMACYIDHEGHTYDFAYGMNWKGQIKDARTRQYSAAAIHKN